MNTVKTNIPLELVLNIVNVDSSSYWANVQMFEGKQQAYVGKQVKTEAAS